LFKKLQDQARIVNIFNDPQLRKQSPGIAATVNGKQISLRELADECLVRYGRERLDTEINLKLLSQALQHKKLQVLESHIDQEIARAAEAYGFLKRDGSPDIDRWLTEVTAQEGMQIDQYVRDAVWPTVALKQIVGDQIEITEEDIQKGFEANYGERVEVLAVVLGNQRTAQEVWDMARKNRSRKFFGELAERFSIEPVSRANYGEVPPIRRHGGQPQIENEAFRLDPEKDEGELSGIVAMGDKFIIMKCLGRTKPLVDNLADVREELVKDIREKKLRLAMVEQFDRLKESAQIDNFLSGTSQSAKPAARRADGPEDLPRGKAAAPANKAAQRAVQSAVRPVIIDPRQRR
jgi:hypothetical protein